MAKRKRNKGAGQNTQARGSGNGGGSASKGAKPKAAKQSPWEKIRGKADDGAGESAGADTAGNRKDSRDGNASRDVKTATDKVSQTRAAKAKSKSERSAVQQRQRQWQERQKQQSAEELKKDYAFSMSHAPRLDDGPAGVHWIQFIPAVLFTAVVILLVRQYNYARDMSIYYWSSESAPPTEGNPNLVEFFSHYKVELIGWSILLMGIMIAYRLVTQQFAVKKSILYWPMLGYIVFVFLSFVLSKDKDVAWNGWNDRFEGTAVVLCYFAALFFIINSVNSERNIKFIVYPVAGVSVILSAIGLSQLTGHDFFRTVIGQKLIVPNIPSKSGDMTWDLIDKAAEGGKPYLSFTFQNNEIYQTVYNINYVSFYLTLLIPLFAMMVIWNKGLLKKVIWGAVLALVVMNFFGAKSSGGMLGMAVAVILVVVVLNKRLIEWWRPVLIVLGIIVVMGVVNVGMGKQFGGISWVDELKDTATKVGLVSQETKGDGASVPGKPDEAQAASGAAVQTKNPQSHLDYFATKDNTLTFSVDGNVATLTMSPQSEITVADSAGTAIGVSQDTVSTGAITLADERFRNVFFMPAKDEAGTEFMTFNIVGDSETRWPFVLTGEGKTKLEFRNALGKDLELVNVPHLGFKDNPGFGSGRGYIWSASLPLIKDTIFVGHGADTYCLYFPHKDYVGKYNAGWNINLIVDKPHNMYIAVAINTGLISLIALLALFIMYIVQSIRLYRRRKFTTFAEFAGAGIFFGISGFVVSGVVDDSTVSVMPIFYGLLATGIATNILVRKRADAEIAENDADGGAEA